MEQKTKIGGCTCKLHRVEQKGHAFLRQCTIIFHQLHSLRSVLYNL